MGFVVVGDSDVVIVLEVETVSVVFFSDVETKMRRKSYFANIDKNERNDGKVSDIYW